jgi:hypothetical protein
MSGSCERAAGSAHPVTRLRGVPVTGRVLAGMSRPPVNGVAPLIAMQMQLREMLRVLNRLVL